MYQLSLAMGDDRQRDKRLGHAALPGRLYFASPIAPMPAILFSGRTQLYIRIAIAVLILLPLFFQLQGTVYHSPKVPMYDSGGVPSQVPLPISILICLAGPLLIGGFARARLSFAVILAMLATMVLATIIATFGGARYGLYKALLSMQCL